MDDKLNSMVATPFRRVGLFLRDFLPENNLQLLFPFASLVLYIGASRPWLPGGHVLYALQYQHQDGTLWFDITSRLAMLRYQSILYGVTFSFLGSVALWCLSARNVWRKFAAWVLLPGGLAIASFLAIVFLSRPQPVSLLEPWRQVLQEDLREFPARLLQLGLGFYITLLGMASVAASLWIASVRRVPLPVRFREGATREKPSADTSEFGRRVFLLVIATAVIGAIIGLAIFTSMFPAPEISLPWYDAWPRNFPAFHWLPGLFNSLVIVACAVLMLRRPQNSTMTSSTFVGLYIAIAFVLPLTIALLPRLILKALSDYSTALHNVPYEFIGFRAFPWALVLFLIAALEEFTLRVYLQNPLEERFGLKRAGLLVALLWWMLLSSGFGPIPGLRTAIPGVSVVISLLTLILYNIPLAWLWSRTRSLWLVTLMHGTILVFRAGDAAYGVYFTFKWLYWAETAAWLCIAWLLFKRFPVAQPASSVALGSD